MFEHGSETMRIDFHLHTNQDKEFKYNSDNFEMDYIEKLKEQEIKVGVITNHNKFNKHEFSNLRREAKKQEIFLIPGVEISVKEGQNGVHTLIAFSDDWLDNGNGADDINNALNQLFTGIQNRENENTRCAKDLIETFKLLDSFNKDYFVVFAHIEQSSGFINECGGGLITSLSANPLFKKRVYGFQKLRTYDKKRLLRDWMGYELAFVEGSDPKEISEIGKGEKKSYIKIGEYDFSTVKYALADYENRIFTAIPNISHGYIDSLECIGGKLNGKIIKFSKELNTLIGIRGSGKSSILEILRYGIDLPASTDSDYKNSLVKNVLGSGGQVNILLHDKFGKQYEIRKILNETPSILDSEGNDLRVSIFSIINNPLYFGQKDLSLTKNGYEFDLLNKIVGDKTTNQEQLIEEQNSILESQIKLLIDVSAIPEKINELKKNSIDLEHKLKIFAEKGVDEKLKKQTTCNTDELKLQDIIDKLENILKGLTSSYEAEELDALSLDKYDSEYNSEIFLEAKKNINETISIFQKISKFTGEISTKHIELKKIKSKMSEKIKSLKEEFAEIKREINDDSLDLDNFVKYAKDLELNNIEIKKLSTSLNSKEVIITNIKTSIRKRNEVLKEIFLAYLKEIEKVNSSQSELVISIEFKGDKNCLKDDIKSAFKGTGVSDSKYQNICDKFSDFVSIIEDYFVNDGKELRAIITENEFLKIGERIVTSFSELIKCTCPNSVKIKYHGKLLSKHSIGQRASALVLFILSQKDNDVIIIDQPEDDLDNQVIYKELIKTIKEKKPYIQFIFATHNANIPVLGDAEKIITTGYSENEIEIVEGTIDTKSIHSQIVDIMEGGPDAFRKRNEIYTSWK